MAPAATRTPPRASPPLTRVWQQITRHRAFSEAKADLEQFERDALSELQARGLELGSTSGTLPPDQALLALAVERIRSWLPVLLAARGAGASMVPVPRRVPVE